MGDIVITNARVHNLRGIDVTIPRNSFIKPPHKTGIRVEQNGS